MGTFVEITSRFRIHRGNKPNCRLKTSMPSSKKLSLCFSQSLGRVLSLRALVLWMARNRRFVTNSPKSGFKSIHGE